ncbi:hypothetical protein PFNF135_06279 [Plasmodium falciparum NF135/5.C10]|uniref:Surface antigen n=1 Tax=Plasmodium falciparum NF135/5.C10 TaxID=1036726 RepID=W4I886_PLAFA|nr:hypothetical protein PFNF135_06279 [Plasmodium falciparum NF135/5.C10]
MSTLEKELLDTYVETFGEESNIMLKSGRCPNDDEESDDSSSCGCTDINNAKLAKTKGRDKYLVNLKERCKGGIGFCTVGSILLTLMGFIAAGLTTATYFEGCKGLSFIITILHCFFPGPLKLGLQGACGSFIGDIVGTVPPFAMNAFQPYGSCIPPYALPNADKAICSTVPRLDLVPGHVTGNSHSLTAIIESHVKKILAESTNLAESTTLNVTPEQTAIIEARNIAAVDATYASSQIAIIASVVVILVIVLVMVIIYLILRYRRKKKMTKKLQYTKLLNQ